MNDELTISLWGSGERKNNRVTKTLNIDENLWEEFNTLCENNENINRTTCFNELLKAGFLYLQLEEYFKGPFTPFTRDGIYYSLAPELEEKLGENYLAYFDRKFMQFLDQELKKYDISKRELFSKIGKDIDTSLKEGETGFFLSFREVSDILEILINFRGSELVNKSIVCMQKEQKRKDKKEK